MADYLKVPGRDWPAHDRDVKQMFGLDLKTKWPEEGMPHRQIQGIDCWVDSIQFGKFRIRASCTCPHCDKIMPIGRLAQHWRLVHRKEMEE